MRCGTTGSCQISCQFRDCRGLLVTNLTHVSGAIASAQTFTFRTTSSSSNYLEHSLQHCLCSEQAQLFESQICTDQSIISFYFAHVFHTFDRPYSNCNNYAVLKSPSTIHRKTRSSLSQKGRAMLRVVENIADTQSYSRSLKFYTREQGVCQFLLVFYGNHVCILYRL